MEYSMRKGYHKNITLLVAFHTLLAHRIARSRNPVAQTNPYLLSSTLNKRYTLKPTNPLKKVAQGHLAHTQKMDGFVCPNIFGLAEFF
jgi:hypothetical protein